MSLIRIIIAGAAIFFVYTLLRKIIRPSANKDNIKNDNPVELVQDPTCNTFIEKDTKYKVTYYDDIYYFCSEHCRQAFIKKTKEINK